MSSNSRIIVNNKGGNGCRGQDKGGVSTYEKAKLQKPYQDNYVCSTTPSATFNHQFRNVHHIQSPTLDTGEATALWKKFHKMKYNLSKISGTLAPYRCKFLLLILQRTAKKLRFLLATPISIILLFEIINRFFRMKTL